MVRVELCRELELVHRAHYHSELVGPGEDSEQVRDEASFTELVAVSTINIFQFHQSHYPRPPNSLSPLLRPYYILHTPTFTLPSPGSNNSPGRRGQGEASNHSMAHWAVPGGDM